MLPAELSTDVPGRGSLGERQPSRTTQQTTPRNLDLVDVVLDDLVGIQRVDFFDRIDETGHGATPALELVGLGSDLE